MTKTRRRELLWISNTTSTGDLKCIAVILFCVLLDKTRTPAHKNDLGILSLKMQTISSVIKVALAV